MKKKQLFLCLILATLELSCAWFQTAEKQEMPLEKIKIREVLGIGMVEPVGRILQIHSFSSGLVREVFHQINDTIRADEPIFALEDQKEKIDLEQSLEQYQTQKIQLAAKKKQLELLGIQFENQEKNFERDLALYNQKIISEQAFDNSQTAFKTAEQNLEITKTDLRSLQAKLEEMQTLIELKQRILKEKIILAPTDGLLLSQNIQLGENVSPQQVLGLFAPLGDWLAITEIDEQFAYLIQMGMSAKIRTQGKDSILSEGKVILASAALQKKSLFVESASNMEDRRVREVHVLLEDKSKVLLGQKVEVLISLE